MLVPTIDDSRAQRPDIGASLGDPAGNRFTTNEPQQVAQSFSVSLSSRVERN
jgi:hypothetical protein